MVGDGVENAAAGVELADLRLDLLGRALEEELFENFRGLVFRRNRDARTGAGKAAAAGDKLAGVALGPNGG